MKKLRVDDFRLEHTLECGQLFRYFFLDGFYYVSAGEAAFKVRQENQVLRYEGVDANGNSIGKRFITRFFRLDDNYHQILRNINIDNQIGAAISRLRGLRLIRQEPLECLVSYMVSQNSNIPRIKKGLNALASSLGRRFRFDGMDFYTFPQLKQLKRGRVMQKCGLGYRCKYLQQLSRQLDMARLNQLHRQSYQEAKGALTSLQGAGEKVAECVMLFSLDFLDAFPVDVWVRRAVERLYFNGKKITQKKAGEFGRKHFGRYAGYANQFLFYHWRQKWKSPE